MSHLGGRARIKVKIAMFATMSATSGAAPPVVLGAYNDKISSMRVEPANRSETCNDVREGEIALYRNQ